MTRASIEHSGDAYALRVVSDWPSSVLQVLS
jgi:hypothetical protein